MGNVLISLRFVMAFLIVRMARMNTVVLTVVNVSPINLCAVTLSVWIVSGVVMAKMIVVIIRMRKVVIRNLLALHAVMMNSNVVAVIVYPNPSSVMTPMIAVMVQMKSVAVSCCFLYFHFQRKNLLFYVLSSGSR